MEVRNAMQSRKVRQCSVECSAGAKLSVDHFFHSITRDNGDVQHRKKNLVFPGSAIEHQDGIAGAKDVSKSRLVYSVGTAINLQMDRMDLLRSAARPWDRAWPQGGRGYSNPKQLRQSELFQQGNPLQPVHDRLNAPSRKNEKGAPGLAFETWDPRNQCSMDTHDVTAG